MYISGTTDGTPRIFGMQYTSTSPIVRLARPYNTDYHNSGTLACAKCAQAVVKNTPAFMAYSRTQNEPENVQTGANRPMNTMFHVLRMATASYTGASLQT